MRDEWVYWTKVSTNTIVRIGHIAKRWRVPDPMCLQNRDVANTIVQLQSRSFLGTILRRACQAEAPGAEFTIRWARELIDGRHHAKSEDKSK